MTTLEQRALAAIRHSGMLKPGDRVGIAVSGGADSVALLRLLENLRDPLGITLLVAHFDHGLRGAESTGDAEFVSGIARARAIACVIEREDVAAAAAAHKWNIEDAARRLRYAFFERVVSSGRATRIAVAHTLDDQAETVLGHLIRGTGPTGLAGIYPVAGSVVRPLLGERRETLRRYLENLGQSWREDSTNGDICRLRSRIRQRLLPLLASDFSPRVAPRLAALAELAREEQTFWETLVDDRLNAIVRMSSRGVEIRTSDLLAPLKLESRSASRSEATEKEDPAQRALTERLIRRLYQELRGTRQGLTAVHVRQVIHLASVATSGKRVELPGRILVERDFDCLKFSAMPLAAPVSTRRKRAGSAPVYRYVVRLPDRGTAVVSVPELNRCFHLKVIDWPFVERDTKRADTALDAQLLRPPLVLRNWLPGDSFRPRGRRSIRKLKEMFVASRVPARERARWPVLESAGELAWARGMVPAEQFCTTRRTVLGVLIEEGPL